MPDLSPYRTHEPPAIWTYEITDFAGFVISLICYGMTSVVCSISIYYLATTIKSKAQRRHNIVWIICIIILFAGGTVNISGNIISHIQAWIYYRSYPGGPPAYSLNVSTFNAADWMTLVNGVLVNTLLIYRVYILYRIWYITIVPILALICTMVFGPLFILQISQQAHSWFAEHTLQLTIPYFATELSLNILLTFLLSGRLILMARFMSRTLGEKHGRLYTNIARMIIETSLPYAIVSFVLLVLYVKDSFGANIVLPIYVQVQIMTPALITIRVCQGRAWNYEHYETRKTGETAINHSGEKSTKISVLQFRHTVHEVSTSTAADLEGGYNNSHSGEILVIDPVSTTTSTTEEDNGRKI